MNGEDKEENIVDGNGEGNVCEVHKEVNREPENEYEERNNFWDSDDVNDGPGDLVARWPIGCQDDRRWQRKQCRCPKQASGQAWRSCFDTRNFTECHEGRRMTTRRGLEHCYFESKTR